tara:strand:- start:210 stop:521 length:312 start_codon:yes stop_codon:yes gene_type:complete
MSLPTTINLGQVWSVIRRDRSKCVATRRVSLAEGEVPGYLPEGSYNGGFLRVTEVTEKVPDNNITESIRRENHRNPNKLLSVLTPLEFRALYIIHRHYETTTG